MISAHGLAEHIEAVQLVENIELDDVLAVLAGDRCGSVGQVFSLLIRDLCDAVVVEVGPGGVEFLFVGVGGGVDSRGVEERVVEVDDFVVCNCFRWACALLATNAVDGEGVSRTVQLVGVERAAAAVRLDVVDDEEGPAHSGDDPRYDGAAHVVWEGAPAEYTAWWCGERFPRRSTVVVVEVEGDVVVRHGGCWRDAMRGAPECRSTW